MRSNLFRVAISAALLLASTLCAADSAPADLVQALRGTKWQGSFGEDGLTGQIRIRFVPELTAAGDLRYFHAISGPVAESKTLGKLDKSCKFTPRSVHLDPVVDGGKQTGTITVYLCADSADEERKLNELPRTTPVPKIPVSQFQLRPDGQLEIHATIGVVPVTYLLSRQPSDASDGDISGGDTDGSKSGTIEIAR